MSSFEDAVRLLSLRGSPGKPNPELPPERPEPEPNSPHPPGNPEPEPPPLPIEPQME